MSKRAAFFLAMVAFGLGMGAGVLVYLYVTSGSGEPSRDIDEVAPTLSLDGPTPTPPLDIQLATQIAQVNTQLEANAAGIEAISTRLDTLSDEVAGLAIAPVAAPTETGDTAAQEQESESTDEAPPPEETTPEASAEERRGLFRIVPDESEARYLINETFTGGDRLVEGTTRQVGGDIIVNFSNPPASQVGQIVVNARTLHTDISFRDQAVRAQILETVNPDYEFITFTPTRLNGLPDSAVEVGDTLEFQIVGDLTIKDITREVTFDAEVTVAAEDRIEGIASTVVVYADFDIGFRLPPTISAVADETTLEIEFVATAVEE